MSIERYTDLPVIYGIMEAPTAYGVQAHALDGQTGEVIDSHFCSSESFAISDLGFSGPLIDKGVNGGDHPTKNFNKERNMKYSERYPDGYWLEWVGFWWENEETTRLRNLANTKPKEIAE